MNGIPKDAPYFVYWTVALTVGLLVLDYRLARIQWLLQEIARRLK